MGIQIKSPNITASDDRQRLQQIQSYLYQMAQQLQWAFDTIEAGGSGGSSGAVQTAQGKKAVGRSPAETFSDIKSLIIKSADIVNAYYDQISARLEGLYVAQSDFGTFVEQTELELKANSQGITQNYSDIQQVQVDVAFLGNSVGSVQEDVGNLQTWADSTQADIFYMEGDVTALQENVGKTQNDISGLQTDVGKVQGDVSGLQNSMGSAEGNISDLQTDMGKVQGDVSGLHGDVETLDDRVNSTNERVDGVQQDLNELHTVIVQTNAYIKSGKIDEKDGIPVFGLEIGQTNNINGQTVFDKFARFTADRLSFFDRNDVEVAYISDYHLYITNAIITGSLVLMQQFSVSQGNQSIDFKWLGG